MGFIDWMAMASADEAAENSRQAKKKTLSLVKRLAVLEKKVDEIHALLKKKEANSR